MSGEFFPEVKKNFGFGLMRLPMAGDKVDKEQTDRMADAFIAAGFNYFDTAHGYIGGQSETAFRESVAKRYPRGSYLITNKLSSGFFEKEEDIVPFFESQLEACGVDYFDFYLMHAQDSGNYEKYKRCRAYETALKLKEQGRIRHLGISFHDSAEMLDRILTDYPQIEAVQIQLNYVDYEDPGVQSRLVYEVCEKHGKPVIIMEPVKGGSLINLPEDAQKVFDELNRDENKNRSNANFAIRFAAGLRNVFMVLSGMSAEEQMEDNIGFMRGYEPLSEPELAAVCKVSGRFNSLQMIPCTACRYCVPEGSCPMDILIPDLFYCYNRKTIFHSWNQDMYYENVLTRGHGRASDCIGCGRCESMCPQHLQIRSLLKDVAAEFDKQE